MLIALLVAVLAQEKPQGPLSGLPSAPGPHLSKIKEGEWVNLGQPAADPKWGRARGRSWGAKMPYAPELKGAFLNGQGVHGYIKPDGYFMDDIWFYDWAGHRWICLYPGTDTKKFVENIEKGELTVDANGQLADKKGHAVPFSALPGHSYQNHTYDTDQRKYIFGWALPGIGTEQHVRDQEWCKKGTALLREKGKQDNVMGTPYFFNTVSGRFERQPAEGKLPPPYKFGVQFYLPTRKTLWVLSEDGTLLCDLATRKWVNAGAKGPTPPGLLDLGACYDSKRDRIYCGKGPYADEKRVKAEGNVYIYDVKTNAWSNPPGQAGAFPASNSGSVHYDAANDRVLAFWSWDGKGSVSVWNPEKAEWEGSSPLPAEVTASRGCWHGFYAPEANAHFVYIAGDSDDRGTMWAYRWKSPKK